MCGNMNNREQGEKRVWSAAGVLGSRRKVGGVAAVTHTEVQAFVRLYNVCAVIEVAEETARLCLWTQTESNHRTQVTDIRAPPFFEMYQ